MSQHKSSHQERVEMVQAKLDGMSLCAIAKTYGYHHDVDVLTSAPLETRLYPASLGVSWRDVQANLRLVFALWGLPDFLGMDRGSIFVGASRLEWPSFLLLWFVGLGIIPRINDPAHPTQNAQVERHNLTWQNHGAGVISLGNRNLYVSRRHMQQTVGIHYDLDQGAFVAYEPHEQQTPIAVFSHPFVTPQYIIGWDKLAGG